MWRLGLQVQTRLKPGLVGFLIPFFFLGNPVLLIGADTALGMAESLWAMFTASVGTIALVGGLEGWFLQRSGWAERLILIAVAPLMLYPGTLTDWIGFGALAAVVGLQIARRRRLAA